MTTITLTFLTTGSRAGQAVQELWAEDLNTAKMGAGPADKHRIALEIERRKNTPGLRRGYAIRKGK